MLLSTVWTRTAGVWLRILIGPGFCLRASDVLSVLLGSSFGPYWALYGFKVQGARRLSSWSRSDENMLGRSAEQTTID